MRGVLLVGAVTGGVGGAAAASTAATTAGSGATPVATARAAAATTAGATSTGRGGDDPLDPRVVARDRGAAPVEVLAAQLRRDPLYVSPSLTRIASPAAVARLRRRLAAMPMPTYLAIVPRLDDGPRAQTAGDLLTILADRVGGAGLFVLADGTGYGLDARAVEVTPKGEVGRAGLVALQGVARDEGPLARADAALRYLATGVAPPRAAADEGDDRERLPWIVFGVVSAVAFLLPVGLVLAGPRARARRHALRAARAAAKEERTGRVSAPEAGEARGEALDAVAGLARAIAEDPAPPARAVRAYDAASHVLGTRSPAVVDLVGAATLARTGRAWLAAPDWRPCFFDPRHGRATDRTRWRRGQEDVAIATCAACAADVRAHRPPAMLGDRGRPYFERDTVWARTGFGAVDDELADIVLAGDGRRG